MIDRYITDDMSRLWDMEKRTKRWLDVEIAVCEGREKIGELPVGTTARIRAKARFDLSRMAEIERETRHDLMAFVRCVQESLGSEGNHFHEGVTSYDIVDTALGMTLRDACQLIYGRAQILATVTLRLAAQYRDTPQVGRTHGIVAEPITFGFKLAGWYAEMSRNVERLGQAREMVSVGKISGAVGTHANVDPRVEEHVCHTLGLAVDPASTQIVTRDRHAQLITTLAIVASSLERYATEIRNLARTEIREVAEHFTVGQKGSSAMPHKRNPWNCETVTGLARVVRGYVVPALEAVTTWHERDLSNSSMERIILPDACSLVEWMLVKFTSILDNLVVYPDRMAYNLDVMGGIIHSEAVMLALIGKGLSREQAYTIAQRNAAVALDGGTGFRRNVEADPEVTALLSPHETEACFDLQHHLRNVHLTFDRLGI